MNFAQNLKFLMDYHGLTKYRLAKDLSISQTTIANWLELKNVPHPNMLNAIANRFQISVEDLTDRDLQSEGLGLTETNKKSPIETTMGENKKTLIDLCLTLSEDEAQSMLKLIEVALAAVRNNKNG